MKNSVEIEKCIFKLLWKTSLVGLALVDEEGNFIKVNPQFCNILEYNQYELENKRYQDVTHPDDVKAGEMMGKKLLLNKEDEEYYMKKKYLSKTGKIIWVLLKINKITDSDGKFIAFLKQITSIIDTRPEETVLNSKKIRKNSFFSIIKEYSSYIIAGLVALGIIFSEFFKK